MCPGLLFAPTAETRGDIFRWEAAAAAAASSSSSCFRRAAAQKKPPNHNLVQYPETQHAWRDGSEEHSRTKTNSLRFGLVDH